jgi:hypothetical protein
MAEIKYGRSNAERWNEIKMGQVSFAKYLVTKLE